MALEKKKLEKTDIEQKLSVPTGWLGQVLPDPEAKKENEIAIDVALMKQGKVMKEYQFVLSTRNKGGYKKPVFKSKGWLKFVKDNQLKVGDTIHFGKTSSSDSQNYFQLYIEYDYTPLLK